MVGGLVDVVAVARELDDASEQARLVPHDHAQGFEVAGAGGLDVEQPPRRPRQGRVHRQLVRPGVQAQLVRPELPGDGGMVGQGPRQLGVIALVVDTLLKVAEEPRREADELGAGGLELLGDDVMLGGRGRLRRLVDAQFDLAGLAPLGGGALDIRRQMAGTVDGPAVLYRRTLDRLLVEPDRRPVGHLHGRIPVGVEPVQFRSDGLEMTRQCGRVVGVGLAVDVFGWIDREEDEPGLGGHVDVGLGLEVVGVGAPGAGKALGLQSTGGVRHHLRGGAPGPLHLTDRLLGENALDRSTGLGQGLKMARRGQAQPVAEAEARRQSQYRGLV